MEKFENNKEFICPLCGKKIEKISVDYNTNLNRKFTLDDGELNWCEFEDTDCINDVSMMYCEHCQGELSSELSMEILDLHVNF